jgi:hypothetical protein
VGEARARAAALMSGAAQACSNCRFWKHSNGVTGICRWRPPVALFAGMGQNIGGQPVPLTATAWPEVRDDQWCGQHSRSMTVAAVDLSRLRDVEAEGSG